MAERIAPRRGGGTARRGAVIGAIVVGLYAVVLAALGIRGLVPDWEFVASPYGRSIGAWSMYGSYAEVLSVTARAGDEELPIEGIWHGDFVSAATPYVPVELVDSYAAFLHERDGIPAEVPVEVTVVYAVDLGDPITVVGRSS